MTNIESQPKSTDSSSVTPRHRRLGPFALLLVLAPSVSEVLFGATRLTTIFVLIPQIGTWGCATLIIRELARRGRRGWPCVVLLGIALALAEECVIQQTSLAPLPGSDPAHPYGRAFGVNWVYLVWAVGYESIWVVVIPIKLTEMIFPSDRGRVWLRPWGLVACIAVFVIAAFVAWYSWTQVFLPKFFPELAYKVPPRSIITALVAIFMLVAVALGAPPIRRSEFRPALRVPRPWQLSVLGFAIALPWFALIFLAYGAVGTLPFPIPVVAGLALAGCAYFAIHGISRRAGWDDSSALALIMGALSASMLAGFPILILGRASLFDIVGKLVLNVVALFLLWRLAKRLRSRKEPDAASPGVDDGDLGRVADSPDLAPK